MSSSSGSGMVGWGQTSARWLPSTMRLPPSTRPSGSTGRRSSAFVPGEKAMAKMKAAQLPKAGADFQIVERDIPEPGPGHVRIRVQACGVCHSDALAKEGSWPGLAYRRGDFINCTNVKVAGFSYDGGYAEYMIAPVEAVARMPESLDAADAAPLLCAGITTFNALRHSGAVPSDLVAIQGIGGLGHLAIQFAQKFGYQVAAVGRGTESAGLARKLGANVYIDSAATNAAAELQKLGGARVILATAPSAKAMSSLIDGLAANGRMMVIGASADPIAVTPVQLIFGNRSLQGWAAGTPPDSEDTLRFAELTGVRPMIEKYPLAKAGEAYARMMSGKAQFRVVLTM